MIDPNQINPYGWPADPSDATAPKKTPAAQGTWGLMPGDPNASSSFGTPVGYANPFALSGPVYPSPSWGASSPVPGAQPSFGDDSAAATPQTPRRYSIAPFFDDRFVDTSTLPAVTPDPAPAWHSSLVPLAAALLADPPSAEELQAREQQRRTSLSQALLRDPNAGPDTGGTAGANDNISRGALVASLLGDTPQQPSDPVGSGSPADGAMGSLFGTGRLAAPDGAAGGDNRFKLGGLFGPGPLPMGVAGGLMDWAAPSWRPAPDAARTVVATFPGEVHSEDPEQFKTDQALNIVTPDENREHNRPPNELMLPTPGAVVLPGTLPTSAPGAKGAPSTSPPAGVGGSQGFASPLSGGVGGTGPVAPEISGNQSGQGSAPTTGRAGAYVLRDSDGSVVYVGRTSTFKNRERQHGNSSERGTYLFDPIHPTDDYEEQRGLEQHLYDKYNPPLNRIRPISKKNKNMNTYNNAAQQYLNEKDNQ